MTAATLPLPLATDYLGRLERRFAREIAAEAQEWSECASALTAWEDEHLISRADDELLPRHRTTVERLLKFGKLLSSITAQSEFSDKEMAAMVSATQRMLQDKLLMWHGSMSREQQEKIVAAVFP